MGFLLKFLFSINALFGPINIGFYFLTGSLVTLAVGVASVLIAGLLAYVIAND